MKFKQILFFFIILQTMFVASSTATTLTDAFVEDSNGNSNFWDETNAYAPEPILFIHGFNSHCNTWGGPEDKNRITINTLKDYFSNYRKYDSSSTATIQLSSVDYKGRSLVSMYKQNYLETIEFSQNLGHPRDQAKELAYRIIPDLSANWPKPMDTTSSNFQPLLREYYGDNWSNPNNKIILVAHSMGGLVARDYLTSPEFDSVAGTVGLGRHVSKLIMIGTPNFGSYWALAGRLIAFTNSIPDRFNCYPLRGEVPFFLTQTAEEIANGIFDEGVLQSDAVKACNPLGEYIRDLHDKAKANPIVMEKSYTLVGYWSTQVLSDVRGKYSDGKTLFKFVKALAGGGGNPVFIGGKWIIKKTGVFPVSVGKLFNSDGFVTDQSQAYRTSDLDFFNLGVGQIDITHSSSIDGPAPHADIDPEKNISETTKYKDILACLDMPPLLDVISPVTGEISGEKVLIEGKLWDYLPASVRVHVYTSLKEIGLGIDKSVKPIDITDTSVTDNGKYNSGFSFEIPTSEFDQTAMMIIVAIDNAAGFRTAKIISTTFAVPLKMQLYYKKNDGSIESVAKGTQINITKVVPVNTTFSSKLIETFVEQTIVGDHGWVNFNFTPSESLRYRFIIDSIAKNPNSFDLWTTVTNGDATRMYRLVSPVVFVKYNNGKWEGSYPNGRVGDIIFDESEETIVTDGYLTTQDYLLENSFGGKVTYFNRPQVLNIMKVLQKAHSYVANVDQLPHVIGCGYTQGIDLTGNVTYWGYNKNHTKRKLYINGMKEKKEEWKEDALLQGYGNFLSSKYMRLNLDYWPAFGNQSSPGQALLNGFSEYFNAICAGNKNISVSDTIRDLGNISAKGINDESAIAAALLELGRFDIVWAKVMENYNAGKSVANICELYNLIKTDNFGATNISNIFKKYGLLPKQNLVNNTNTVRPTFSWDRNQMLDSIDAWIIEISNNPDFSYTVVTAIIPDTASGVVSFSLNDTTYGILPALDPGQYYWRLKANAVNVPEIRSTIDDFMVNPSILLINSTGGSVVFGPGGSSSTTPVSKKAVRSSVSMISGNVPGTLEIPAGAVNGEVKINVTPMTTTEKLGDYIVLGQKLYEIYPDEYTFLKACTIKFNLSAFTTEINGCGIYRYNFQTKDWDFVGADYDPNTKIMSANTSQLGIYGVLRDTKAPEITNIVDSPDPFSPNGDGANDTTTFNYELNKACNVGIHIVGSNTDVNLAGVLQKTKMNQTPWDGKDNQGKIVSDGKYSYTITATDLLGGQTAASGTLYIFTQKPGAVKGSVSCNSQKVSEAKVLMADSTLLTKSDQGGNFELKELPPGMNTIEILKKGYFKEILENVKITADQTVNVGEIVLSNQAVMAHRVTPEEFSPNNDSYKDQLYLNYTLNRKVPITILINYKGVEVYRYKEEKDLGNNVTTWDGRINTVGGSSFVVNGQIAKSGVYTYQIYALAEEENILQAEGTFILNNGLLKNIRCLNAIFSPNDDGRDDTCEIVYEMDNNGTVDLKIYNSQNQEVVSLMDEVARIPGSYSIEWPGFAKASPGEDGKFETVPDGIYTYKITSYFEEGMLSNTQTGSITVDQNPPQLSGLTPVNGSHMTNVMPEIKCKVQAQSYQGTEAQSQMQNDIEEDRIRMKIDDFFIPITYNPTSGEIIFTPETSLGIGEHIIVVYAADKAGNEAAPLSNVFYIDSPGADNIKPQIKELSVVGLVQTINGYEVYSGKPSVIAKLFDENSSIDITSLNLEIDGEKIVNQSKTIDIMHALPSGKVDSATKKNYWLEQWLYTKEILLYNPQTGTLRFNFLEEVADNSNHTVKLQARDISGNVAMGKEFVFKVNIDRVLPTITELTPLNNSTIKATKPIISCKLADDKSQLDLYSLRFLLDGVEQEVPPNAFNSSTGLLEFQCPLTLEQDTQHIITIDISDMAGNKSTQGMSVFTVKGDKIAPVIVELTPEDGTLVTNKRPNMTAILMDNGDSLVDKSSISLEIDGDNIANTSLIIQQDSQKANTVNVNYTPTSNLTEGEHLLVIKAEDDSNNQASPRSAMFRIGDDNVAPVIDQLKPENNSTITVVRPLISARLKDEGTGIDPSSIVLKIDGNSKQLPEGSYSSATNMLTYVPDIYLTDQAQHVVTIDVKDKAGNSAIRARNIFNIRSLIIGAANVSEIYPAAEGFSNKKPTPIKINLISANGTIVPFSNMLLSLDSQVRPHVYNVSGGEVKFASDPILPEGLHSVKLVAEDNVGNLINVESSFTMDYTKPVISLTKDIRDGDYVDSLESIDFDVVENLSGVDENSINVMVDNKKYSGFNYLASTNKLALAQAEPISDGLHTIELQISDRATNPSDKKALRVQIAGELTVEEVVNFPNPFPQEGTKFTCQLSKPANIRIRIYTLSGELVKRIETEGQAGYNEFLWDATNDWGRKIAQGAYPYVFEADDGQKKIKIKKTCVLKR